VDKTPPEVIETSPMSGALQVPLDSRIKIKFSEAIERQNAERTVFISPLTDPEPEIKIKKDAIEIVPREELLTDRTYIITVGTDLQDAHRVNLDQSYTLAFSTGETIDSGIISGTVFKEARQVSGVSLALFDTPPGESEAPLDSIIPGYITQSGEGGIYSFEYLPLTEYYLVAFEDNNRNRRIDANREMLGVPFDVTELSAQRREIRDINIRLHKIDTSRITLRSVSVNPDNLVKIRFSKTIEKERSDSLILNAMLYETGDSSAVMPIEYYIPLSPYPASDFLFRVSGLVMNTSYTVVFDIGQIYPNLIDSLCRLTYDFKATISEDQMPPVMIESIPADKENYFEPDSSFLFRFSELIDTSVLGNAVELVEAEKDTLAVKLEMIDIFTFKGSTERNLLPGQSYHLVFSESNIKDLAGNSMGDSILVKRFHTMDLDTLGQLSGEIVFSDPEDSRFPVVLSFIPARQGKAARTTIAPGRREFIVSLIPGYYTVTAFVDRNNNDRYDHGYIIPYRLAEPFSVPVDTFRVRTRFESAGVSIEL